jgi:hypothetical protein
MENRVQRRWGPSLAWAAAALFVVSAAFPTSACLAPDTGIFPAWWGGADVAIAFAMVALGVRSPCICSASQEYFWSPALEMAQDVQHLSIGIADEEATNAPGLVGQWVHDLVAQTASRSIDGVHVVDLDRGIRLHCGGRIRRNDANLGRRIARRNEGDNPTLIHRYFETHHVDIELSAGYGLRRLKVRYDPSYCHFVSSVAFSAALISSEGTICP